MKKGWWIFIIIILILLLIPKPFLISANSTIGGIDSESHTQGLCIGLIYPFEKSVEIDIGIGADMIQDIKGLNCIGYGFNTKSFRDCNSKNSCLDKDYDKIPNQFSFRI